MRLPISFLLAVWFASVLSLYGRFEIEGKVQSINAASQAFDVALTSVAGETDAFTVGDVHTFKVSRNDSEIDYVDRMIQANATFYSGRWHLEQIFPTSGRGAKAAGDVNAQLAARTATLSRRDYVGEGDAIPNFALIDQHGQFIQSRQLQGKPFVLNFIFTRCLAPKMCPAASTRMADLQEASRESDLAELQFVSVTFDPAFDSPAVLREYAENYGFDSASYHLLTGDPVAIENILRQFGIRTMDEKGTINHTMATLLIDQRGRVAFRKEGSTWSIDEFLTEAGKLLPVETNSAANESE